MKKFTKQDLREIARAVKKAESKTSGEIVPFVTEQAEEYLEGALIFTLVVLLLTIFTYLSLATWRSVSGLLLWEFCGLLIGALLTIVFPKSRLLFLGQQYVAQMTRQRALKAFYEHGLTHTKHGTGILLALFFLEKRVEVVTDAGISKKIKQPKWDEVVKIIVAEAKKGQIKAGFIQGIARCGELLAKVLPARGKNKNELSDQLIRE